ncbi:MAG TPA: type II toxin-antitoxin system VapC family toxin [Tepidisphaeraceae bacterium]|jgi:PIN domain nuclease of toxin-antitoxin system|nr:type II toxin-antitoxin system VapC family toxin [Tepidisphaeraceae bacterium]
MKLLLDTHIFLWWIMGSDRLSPAARAAIDDPANDVFLSSIAAVEIAAKFQSGKLRLSASPDEIFAAATAGGIVQELPLVIAHALRLATLPLHHRDPFDRLLIAQAMTENSILVTADRRLAVYDVKMLT